MKYSLLIFLVLIGFNVFVWQSVAGGERNGLDIYFLNVGQGDSQFIKLPDGVDILIDGGPNKSVLFELAKVIPKTDKYIDLVILTHPQLDHFGGLYDVINRYKIGAFVFSGRDGEGEAWNEFREMLGAKGVNIVEVGAGDLIRYKEDSLLILSPNDEFFVKEEINESSLVALLASENSKTLFTGDIGFETENYLVEKYDLDVDVLKVPHHGSRFSSGIKFLEEVTPRVSVIGVGDNNYGHPTEAALTRLKTIGSSIYRTDKNGTVRVEIKDGILTVALN